MEKKQKDKGLRKAMQEPVPFRLPTNFAYRTMQKVEEAVRLRERRQERRMLLATIAASLLLCAGGTAAVIHYWGESLKGMFANTAAACGRMGDSWSGWWMLSVLVLVLLVFDYAMRRAYFKRHPEKI